MGNTEEMWEFQEKKSNWDRNKDELHNRLDTAKQRIEKLEDKLIKCPKVNAKKVEKNETEKPRTVGQLQKMCHDMGTLGRRENGEQKKCQKQQENAFQNSFNGKH